MRAGQGNSAHATEEMPMRTMPLLAAFAAFAAAALSLPAPAAPVIYQGVPGDRASFFASVGTTPDYTEDFETVGVTKNAGYGQFTENGITYHALGGTNVWVASPGYNNFGAGVPHPTTSSVLTANGNEYFDVSFSTPADVVAMDVYTNGQGPLVLYFYNDSTLLGTADWSASANDIRFVGFMDTLPVTHFVFTSTNGGIINTGIDNLAIAAAACTLCPEPGALSLALAALGALGFVRRRDG
jgi:hypothetical protein